MEDTPPSNSFARLLTSSYESLEPSPGTFGRTLSRPSLLISTALRGEASASRNTSCLAKATAPKVFFRQVIDAAIGAPVDDADVNADQLRIDADDVAFRNFFGTRGRRGRRAGGRRIFLWANQFRPPRRLGYLGGFEGLTSFSRS